MSAPTMRHSQVALAQYLRNPDSASPPPGVEQRRLDIYQRLVYNNIESFISKGFPVLCSLYRADDWHRLVRGFIEVHSCRTPYFLEIGQEFLQYLMEEYQPREVDPPFMTELAHYEWVELALDVAEESPPAAVEVDDVLAAIPRLSSLAWLLQYRFPVHRVGPDFRPTEAEDPTFLVVYRDRHERVRFMELNAVTARLVELTRENTTATGESLLRTLSGESGIATQIMLETGAEQLAGLIHSGVLAVLKVGGGDDS